LKYALVSTPVVVVRAENNPGDTLNTYWAKGPVGRPCSTPPLGVVRDAEPWMCAYVWPVKPGRYNKGHTHEHARGGCAHAAAVAMVCAGVANAPTPCAKWYRLKEIHAAYGLLLHATT
jgi:hypothetical protein